MRVSLKGVHSATKKLASGKRVTYYYAWRGGPRLEGKPGEPAFHASFNEAVKGRRDGLSSKGSLSYLTDKYRDSPEFAKLAERTKSDYEKLLKAIEAEFSDLPIKTLSDRRSRAEFLEWRDGLAKRSLRQADYAWTVLARVMSWAVDRGYIESSPCTKGGKLYSGNRAEKVWKAADEKAFARCASPAIAFAMLLALWTGQRQGDLLRLTWFAYDGKFIRLKQSKTGKRVVIPVGAPLKRALDALRLGAAADDRIMLNGSKTPWTPDGFRVSWGKTTRRAQITDRTFHDLRGTAVLQLCRSGCTVPQIAAITGHTLHEVQSILDEHYFSPDVELAQSAIDKLEIYHAAKENGLQEADNPLIHNDSEITKFEEKC